MGPSSFPSSGASGAGLSPGTWVYPSPICPGPCSSVPSPQQENAYVWLLSLLPLCRRVAGTPSPWQRSWATSCGPGPQQELGKQITHVTHVHSFVAMHAMCGSGHVCAHGGGIVCVLFRGNELWVCLHACTFVSMQPLGIGTPVCVHTGAGFRHKPVASMCTGPGSSVLSHGCPMPASET